MSCVCFHSFRDNYVDDFRETVHACAPKYDFIVIPQKEKIRTPDSLFKYQNIISTENSISGYESFFNEYRYWGHDILIVQKMKNGSCFLTLNPDGTKIRALAKFTTNKKGASLSISVYSPSSIDSTKQDYSISDRNIFKNSNLELQQEESDLKNKFQMWVDDGATFYMASFQLPRDIDLPTQSHIKKLPFYPIAFSETDSPIEGKYSLHVRFNYESYTNSDYHIKLLRNIDSAPGILSFYVKAVKPDSHLIISKREKDLQGRWIETKPKYHVLLNDTQTHFLSFPFDSFVFLTSMYVLQGASADVILDCIQFIPY